MNDNLGLWNQLKTPPADALKPIQAGRLRGKSDISPQWRLEAMTATFGPIGIGWKYKIEKLWTEPGSEGQVAAFAEIALKIKLDGEWSEPIPGIGGSMFIEAEKRGLYTSDEAYKMAITDALSVAMKQLGVAADIYRGLADGSKYNPKPQVKEPSKSPTLPPTLPKAVNGNGGNGNGPVTAETAAYIRDIVSLSVFSDEERAAAEQFLKKTGQQQSVAVRFFNRIQDVRKFREFFNDLPYELQGDAIDDFQQAFGLTSNPNQVEHFRHIALFVAAELDRVNDATGAQRARTLFK